MHFLIFGIALYFLPAIIAAARTLTTPPASCCSTSSSAGPASVGFIALLMPSSPRPTTSLLSSWMVKTGLSPRAPRWTTRDRLAAACFSWPRLPSFSGKTPTSPSSGSQLHLDSATRIALGQIPTATSPSPCAVDISHSGPPSSASPAAFFSSRPLCAIVAACPSSPGASSCHSARPHRASLAHRLLSPPRSPSSASTASCIPSYDCDCAISILVGVWLLQRFESSPDAQPRYQA